MIFNVKTISAQLLQWVVIILLLCNAPVFAQPAQFKNYSVKDGLPSSEIYDVMQDSKGFMWFATDHGVCRFDGYQFKTFTTNDGLADNTIFECIEDYKGRIWFRPFSGRLSYYYHDSIYRLPINDTLVKLLHAAPVISMSVSTDDKLYLGAHCFPVFIQIDLKNKYTISMFHVPQNEYYIGAYLKSPDKLLEGNSFTPMHLSPNYKIPLVLYNLSRNPPVPMYRFALSAQFTTMLHNKALKLNDNKIATAIDYNFILFNKDSVLYTHTFNSTILNINRGYNKNGLWVVLRNQAPAYYNNGKIINYPILHFLQQKHVTSILVDAEGGTWFTTLYGGVYYLNSFDIKTLNTSNGLPGNKVNVIAVAPDSSIWASTEESAAIVVLHNDSLHYLKVFPPGKDIYATAFLFRKDSSVWIGSPLGVSIYNNLRLSYCEYKPDSVSAICMVPDTNGYTWVNSLNEVRRFTITNHSLHITKPVTVNGKIFSICRNKHGGLWVGAINGLWLLRDSSLTNYGNKYPILKKRIADIHYYTNGDLWVTTYDTGIVIMHHDSLSYLNTDNGLLSNFCKCLYIDHKHTIWVGSNKGLSHIFLHITPSGNYSIDSIKNITTPGLIEINQITGLRNMLYIATNNGLTSFDADKIQPNSTPPPVYITGITINNSPLYNFGSTTQLSYNKNYIVINYVGLTYKDAGNTLYRYKMDGIDKGWVYTKNRDVQYPKLAPGNYTFMVSARNNDGVWSTTPASFSFIITPPFWQTWWARSLAILLIIGFIYWRIKVIEKREKQKTEINRQLATMELKELKKQIDPHFFFNSLNTLSNIVETTPLAAPEFVDELSHFYRYTLDHRNNDFTELDTEIKQGERYINLLQIRFGSQLNATWNIMDKHLPYFIPTFTLQLLIENITKHNIILPENPVAIEIYTTHNNTLIVKNQLQLKKNNTTSTGLGLKSISDRYRILTSKQITISKTDTYFSVELPLLSPAEYENIAY